MKHLVFSLFIGLIACSSPKTQSEKAEAEPVVNDWIVLFDGTSLDQWHEYNQPIGEFENWSIQDGILELKSENPSTRSLVTNEIFSSFLLTVDWKVDSAGNTGIFWGIQESPEHAEPFLTGVEAQLLDNSNYPDRPMIQKAGSVFNLVEATEDVYAGTNKWNTTRVKIDFENNQGMIDLNGKITSTFPVRGQEWDSLLANSAYAHWDALGRNLTGRIGLQEYGHSASFRNIKIKRLN